MSDESGFNLSNSWRNRRLFNIDDVLGNVVKDDNVDSLSAGSNSGSIDEQDQDTEQEGSFTSPQDYPSRSNEENVGTPNALEGISVDEPEGISALRSHLQNLPNREDYKLSGKGKLLNILQGALTGFAAGPMNAIKVTEHNRDAPYQEALQDWSTKEKSLESIGGLDIRNLRNKLGLAEAQNKYYHDAGILADRQDRTKAQEKHWTAQEKETTSHNREEEEIGRGRVSNVGKLRDIEQGRIKLEEGKLGETTRHHKESERLRGEQINKTGKDKPLSMSESDKSEKRALRDILKEEPGFQQYIDVESGIPHLDEKGKPAKKLGGKFLPLVPEDVQALKDLATKIKRKKEELLNQSRSNVVSPNYNVDSLNDDEEEEE